MKNNKGFSLVELIVVIAIMAILAAIAIPTFATFIAKANEASDIDFMNNVEYAVELAYAGEGKQFTKVEVILSEEKGAVSSIKVYISGEGDTEEVELVVLKENNTDTDAKKLEMKNLIASTIDWEYKFKSKSDDLEENSNWNDEEWILTITSAPTT